MVSNRDRADWADACIATFRQHAGSGLSDDEAVKDLIADLGHYAERNEMSREDFIGLVQAGVGMWSAEREDPDGEPDMNHSARLRVYDSPTPPEPCAIDSRGLATILAALRHWQRHQANNVGVSENAIPEDDIATDGGTLEPMRADEIDKLCEMLNVEPHSDEIVRQMRATGLLRSFVDSFRQQIEEDQEINGGDAVEFLTGFWSDAEKVVSGTKPPRFVISIEGGIVQDIVTDSRDLACINFVTVDYDVDGEEEGDIFCIPEEDGTSSRANGGNRTVDVRDDGWVEIVFQRIAARDDR